MPSTITHNYFAKDLYKKLKKDVQLNTDLFLLSNQGHDLLMFYKFWNLKERAQTEKVGLFLQDNKFQQLIEEYIIGLRNMDWFSELDAKSFIYGYIAHHILDSYVHPKVIYETGMVDINDQTTYKYRGLHQLYETLIDIQMMYKRENKINGLAIYKGFPKNVKLCYDAEKLANFSFKNIYNIDNLGTKFNETFDNVYYFMRLFRYDPVGIKKCFYELLDKINQNPNSSYSFLSYKRKYRNENDMLYNNEEWYYPYDEGLGSNKSFDELYNDALIRSKEIIINIENYLENYKFDYSQLKSIIPDVSAVHGLECGKNLKLTKFK